MRFFFQLFLTISKTLTYYGNVPFSKIQQNVCEKETELFRLGIRGALAISLDTNFVPKTETDKTIN